MINIVGAGLAGLSAAITLAEKNIHCRLISVQQSERAQSVLAEGGINAALDTMGEGDSVNTHFEETMKGGCFLADPGAVRGLTENAPATVKKLEALGVPFNRTPDGSIALRSFGGQKKKRTAFSRSSTGKMLMTALTDEVRKYEARGLVTRFAHHLFIRLLTGEEDGRRCTGVRVKDTYTGRLYDMPGTVIMACGGLNGFFPGMTTGTAANTGNAAAVLFSQGTAFAGLEMIQYHPTTFAIPGKRCLISEAARGEGGRLFSDRNGSRDYFMEEKYPELKNLMPRDVVSREIYLKIKEGENVYLDMTGISAEVWNTRLSDLREEILHYLKADPAGESVPVSPGIHYFMGGIYVNRRHETTVPGLYAAGECACQYHGANRLGGNSLLGAIYGGMTAAGEITAAGSDEGIADFSGDDIYDCEVSERFVRECGTILYGGLGIVRDESGIKDALERLESIGCNNAVEDGRKALSRAMLLSAFERRESRGAHYRSDFPDTLDEYRKTAVSGLYGGEVKIHFEDIPGERQEPAV